MKTKASYEVAMLIAKNCKSFAEGDFIKECVMKMVENICPEKKQGFANICLARNTIAWRIEEISSDIKRQLTCQGADFDFFLIACDESTDLSDTAQLLIFMRGVDDEMNVTEELLDLQSLTDQTRGKDLFVSFKQFLLDIQAKYEDVLYHNDVRWLSRGSALQRFYSLKKEIGEFLETKGQPMRELFDPMWLADLGFLVDITKHLNVLNTSFQGKDAAVNQLYSHLKAFATKLQLFTRQLSQAQPNLINFSALQEIMTSFPQDNISAQMSRYAADITSLAGEFKRRFQDFATIEKEISLFSFQFSVDPDDAPDQLQLELIELHCDSELCSRDQQLSLVNFYRQLDKSRFQEIRTLAKKMLSLFGSTYIYVRRHSLL
ncbi:general transcription factor II-I repeat domain-containing protein 2-like [Lithobates pipiens]